jgi:uncharacterized membrane protein
MIFVTQRGAGTRWRSGGAGGRTSVVLILFIIIVIVLMIVVGFMPSSGGRFQRLVAENVVEQNGAKGVAEDGHL